MKNIPISEITGFQIGHAQNTEGKTGCTVIICKDGAASGVDVRGGGPASRETELLKPVNMIERIHAVILSGGSAYGLDAAGGVMHWLEEQGIGFDVGVGVVPIVCGASLFDLAIGDPKCRPDKAMGYAACQNAAEAKSANKQGSIGAGTGATVGKLFGAERMMKSGMGTYAVQLGEIKLGAIVAVNALGDIFDADTGEMIAGLLNEQKDGFASTEQAMYDEISKPRSVWGETPSSNQPLPKPADKAAMSKLPQNTTLGCILTNAKLTKSQANKIAQMAQNGLARTIRPVHTSADGDTIFTMTTGEKEANPDTIGTLAAEVMAKAVNEAVRAAT